MKSEETTLDDYDENGRRPERRRKEPHPPVQKPTDDYKVSLCIFLSKVEHYRLISLTFLVKFLHTLFSCSKPKSIFKTGFSLFCIFRPKTNQMVKYVFQKS